MHRIRTLIPHLQYGQLRQDKILPREALFTRIPKGGKFPPSIKKFGGYSVFGFFIDHLIRRYLADHLEIALLPHDNMTAYELLLWSARHLGLQLELDKQWFWRHRLYYDNIRQFAERSFPRERVQRILFEPEWRDGSVIGHPDLIVNDTVYDIKTTGRFSSMRIDTILQLLCYYCLAQRMNLAITHIGLILPAQETVLRVDLRTWAWEPFWQAVHECVGIKVKLQPDPLLALQYEEMIAPFVGFHTEKDGTLSKTALQLGSHIPYQVFLAGRCNANFKISDGEVQRVAELVEALNLRIYVHSPYTLNLSAYNEDNWTVTSLCNHLRIAARMKLKGVVVHCGVKSKKVEFDDAYEQMYQNIIEACEAATPECPLILETSAGETGELLSKPDDFVAFYLSLPEKTRANLKVCIDTCHVFVAGYKPLQFLQAVDEADIPVALFHYNDSKGPLGCCKDSHARIGRGYVGLDNLIPVALWALKNKIDLVHE